uniref:Uncharacterized protein n=1 Tax=Aegilops tauschii TaxID=37682 RepID=M8BG32_AEGTA
MAAPALKFAAVVLLAALCAAALAPAASGQQMDALAACIEGCEWVACPEGQVCITVCTPLPSCERRCRCTFSGAGG